MFVQQQVKKKLKYLESYDIPEKIKIQFIEKLYKTNYALFDLYAKKLTKEQEKIL